MKFLLAVLKKRKKVTFHDDTIVEPKRAKLDSNVETSGKDDATNEIPKVKKVPGSKEIQSNLSQATTNTLSVLANIAITTSNHTLPNHPPKFFPDLITESVTETVDEADYPCTEDTGEMPPLENIEP